MARGFSEIGSSKLHLPPLVRLDLLFNGIFHAVSNDGRVLSLSQANYPANGLLLDGRIPLQLENVDTCGYGEIESKSAGTESHQQCGNGWVGGEFFKRLMARSLWQCAIDAYVVDASVVAKF